MNTPRNSRNHKVWFLLILSLTLFLSGCQDEEVEPAPSPTDPNITYVNDWIKENMDFWYLWNETMPQNTDRTLTPDVYFTRLLNKDDRFSWIQDDYQQLINSLDGINMEAGLEYVLYRESSSSENVVAQILYVKPNSPALQAGLKRGDLITQVNGTGLTTSNYRDLIAKFKENHRLTIKPLNIEQESFGSEMSVNISVVQYAENPNHLWRVIDSEGKKIGYYVYTFFSPGDGNIFDTEMDNIFQKLKDESITDLVLDLRFNSGGSEVSAKNLASLVADGVTSNSVFFRRQYNEMVTEQILNTPTLGEKFLTSLYLEKGSNVGAQLAGKKVYILTSSRTASASELIINSLKPYMQVVLIGDVTYGKNVGSISIYDENDARNKWGLQPIVVRVANSQGSADYSNGFRPDIENKDNSLFLYPLGDARENLLSIALEQITGKIASTGRKTVRAQSMDRELLHHSLDFNPRSFRLMMDESSLPRLDPR